MRRDEGGFTLIELMVAMSVLVIASMALLNFLEGTTNVTARVEKNVASEESLQVALRTVTSDLRSATALSACSGIDYRTCVTIDIPRTSGTSACPARRMRYWLSSGNLLASRTDYNAGCTTSTTVYSTKRVLTGVTSTGAIFSYYDKYGTSIDPLSSDSTAVPAASSVSVSLKVAQGVKGAPDVSLSAPAALRNKSR